MPMQRYVLLDTHTRRYAGRWRGAAHVDVTFIKGRENVKEHIMENAKSRRYTRHHHVLIWR